MAARDNRFMEVALQLARQGAQRGEVPVGAVVVVDGRIVGWGHNTRHASRDPFGHAEMVALNMACDNLGDWRLGRSSMYVTLEPCVMCAGALLQARLERIVYGCRDPKAGAARSLYALFDDPRAPHRAVVAEGVCETQCTELLTQFFSNLRSNISSDER